jgi:hypothetical protein
VIGLLSIIAIGFFLGMRHATDPDHVIAVTTIVSEQRSAGRAAWIGAFWGLGHTVTIFAVGSAIILFNVVIPARVGLAMEFSVGLMLILLEPEQFFSGASFNNSHAERTRPCFSRSPASPRGPGSQPFAYPFAGRPFAYRVGRQRGSTGQKVW